MTPPQIAHSAIFGRSWTHIKSNCQPHRSYWKANHAMVAYTTNTLPPSTQYRKHTNRTLPRGASVSCYMCNQAALRPNFRHPIAIIEDGIDPSLIWERASGAYRRPTGLLSHRLSADWIRGQEPSGAILGYDKCLVVMASLARFRFSFLLKIHMSRNLSRIWGRSEVMCDWDEGTFIGR